MRFQSTLKATALGLAAASIFTFAHAEPMDGQTPSASNQALAAPVIMNSVAMPTNAQPSNTPTDRVNTTRPDNAEPMPHHKDDRREHMRQLTPQQRAELKQKAQQRHARRLAMNQACVNHDNQKINVKIDDKIIPGKCKTVFRPQPKQHLATHDARSAT